MLWLEADKFLLDTANLQDVGLSVFELHYQPHKATSANTILPSASHGRRIPFAGVVREHSLHAMFLKASFSNSLSIPKAGKVGGRRPPLQRLL